MNQGLNRRMFSRRRRLFFVISNSSLIRACVNDDDEVQSELVFEQFNVELRNHCSRTGGGGFG
jgi:hypothetical protein